MLMPGRTLMCRASGGRATRLCRPVDDDAFFRVAPDWVCEVLSPSTAVLDRKHKLPIYAREGVTHVWLVDPLLRTLEVLRRGDGGWVLVGTWSGDDRVRAEPFDAIELELGILWADVVLKRGGGGCRPGASDSSSRHTRRIDSVRPADRRLEQPIGSGVTESTAKTVVGQRAKNSGQR